MVTGPQQVRLEQALSGASEGALNGAANEWKRCAELLVRVADALDRAALAEKSVGGHTGPAMAKAFRAAATGMRAKQDEISEGKVALIMASDAVVAARHEQTHMDQLHPLAPDPGPYRPPPGPNDGEDLPLRTAHQVKVDRYDQSLLDREEAARKAADDLDTEYAKATDKMKQIHGIPDPVQSPQPPQDPAAPPTGTTPPSGGRTPPHTSGVHTVGTDSVHTVHPTTHHTHSTTGETHHPTTTTVTPVFDPTHPTVTHPVPDATTTDSTTGTTGVIGGGAGGVSAPLAGGLGVAAGGGLAGAAISGIRGGLAPTGSVPGAAARPIGASTRAGAPGALGRSGAAGAGSPTSRTTGGRGAGGRGGTGGRGAAGAGAGGGAGGRGGRGGRRGGPAGAGAAAGRRGAKLDQDEQGRDRDLFDDGQEWIDDAEAAPGVID